MEAKSSFDLLFGKPKEINFLDVSFDFKIDPIHFMEWLKLEGEDLTGEYATDCSSMCEYSCLYIAMMFHDKELKGDMKIYYGNFGFWEHYWIGYLVDGAEYFIDLTLKQFCRHAPKLSITKASNESVAGSYSYLSEGESLKDYVIRQKAFMLYANPITMEKPPINLDNIFLPFGGKSINDICDNIN